MSRSPVLTVARFRSMDPAKRSAEAVRLLTAQYPEALKDETLDFRARLVTELREARLWPREEAL